MTQESMLTLLTAMTGETDDAVLLAYLELAAEKVIKKCYPFDPTKTEVPDRYKPNQVEIAAYLLNKRGAEGETRHSENGIDRTYADASVPDSMLKDIVPFGKVFGV